MTKTNHKLTITPGKVFGGILVLLWTIFAFGPFFFMLLATFKERSEFFKKGVFAWPESFTFVNYQKALQSSYFISLRNSMVVVILSLVILIAAALLASYVFSRLPLKMNKWLYLTIIACMSIPIHVAFIPVFLLTKQVGIYDTLAALVGPYVAFNLPLTVFILTGFMKLIPNEIEESAEMDGCGLIRIFFSIIMPLSLPGIATLSVYNAINMWNEFSFALILTQSESSRTLPFATWQYQGEYASDLPMIMTILTLATLPMMIAFLVGQDKLVKGMMVGAVKG